MDLALLCRHVSLDIVELDLRKRGLEGVQDRIDGELLGVRVDDDLALLLGRREQRLVGRRVVLGDANRMRRERHQGEAETRRERFDHGFLRVLLSLIENALT